MNFTGQIRDMYVSLDGQTTIAFTIDETPGDLEKLKDKKLSIKVSEYKKKRSLDANAYFHAMADKLRMKVDVIPWSMARMKNHLISDYGQVMYLDDGLPLIYKTNAPPEYVRELEEPHLNLVKTDIERGREVYFYRMYRGSHTYNTAEMSRLIDGTIEECKAQGIETMTPIQIARMMEAWERKNEKREQEASVY